MNIDTLIHAKWIIPVEPENTVYENYALAIKNDKIIALLGSDDARKKFTATEELVLEHHALIPGLINTHTHAAMSLFRGIANDLPLMDWLNNHIWPAEKKWISPGRSLLLLKTFNVFLSTSGLYQSSRLTSMLNK